MRSLAASDGKMRTGVGSFSSPGQASIAVATGEACVGANACSSLAKLYRR